jgi:hypothetical protein
MAVKQITVAVVVKHELDQVSVIPHTKTFLNRVSSMKNVWYVLMSIGHLLHMKLSNL